MASRKPQVGVTSSAANRMAQMSAQEQLIATKKRELEQKLLSQKMQQQQETLSKMKKDEDSTKALTKLSTTRG